MYNTEETTEEGFIIFSYTFVHHIYRYALQNIDKILSDQYVNIQKQLIEL